MKTIVTNFPKKTGGHAKQEQVWADKHRFINIEAGRRGGKDWIGIRKAIKKIYTQDYLSLKKRIDKLKAHNEKYKDEPEKQKRYPIYSVKKNMPRLIYWFVAPNYSMNKVIAKHILNYIDHRLIQYDGTSSNTPFLWLYPEIKIEFKSGQHPESLVAEGLNGIYITETARLKSRVWNDNLRPTLADKQGWGIFTTTPLGHNWYVEEIAQIAEKGENHDPEWTQYKWKTIENTKCPGLLAEVEKNKKTMPKKYFLRNYEASRDAFHGQVYDEFDASVHLQDFEINMERYKVVIAGMDWGYTHHGGFLVVGITHDSSVDVIYEFSKDRTPVISQSKEQESWKDIALREQSEKGIELFYCGVDEPAYIAEFKRAGIFAAPCNNDVKAGIQLVSTLMHVDENGHTRLRIHKKNCPRLSKYLPAYTWNENKDEELSETPKKENDDECDMLRYAIYSGRKWLDINIPDYLMKKAA